MERFLRIHQDYGRLASRQFWPLFLNMPLILYSVFTNQRRWRGIKKADVQLKSSRSIPVSGANCSWFLKILKTGSILQACF